MIDHHPVSSFVPQEKHMAKFEDKLHKINGWRTQEMITYSSSPPRRLTADQASSGRPGGEKSC
jgi:hypothetical protein